MSEISFQEKRGSIPTAVSGIQVNCCKNPACKSFGLWPENSQNYTDNNIKRQTKDHSPDYGISGVAKGKPALKCKACGQITSIKSNRGVFEERERLRAYLEPRQTHCPNEACGNFGIPVSESPDLYYRFGKTSGNQRYQCKSCRKTFSDGNKRRKQRRPEINKRFYSLLMNTIALNRVLEHLDMAPETYYRKLDWLYEQACGFIREREHRLLESYEASRLYLSTDRQTHISNWRTREDKRNTELSAITTACNRTSYIFGWHFNYDPSVKSEVIENHAREIGDLEAAYPRRRYARFWLQQDFIEATNASFKRSEQGLGLVNDIASQYEDEESRDDPDSVENIDGTVHLPDKGMLVRSEYTMHGHFQLLNSLLQNIEKVRFYVDQESGIHSAFTMAFADRVKDHSADAFYVKIGKNMTVDEKRRRVSRSRSRIGQLAGIPYSGTYEEKQLALQRAVMHQIGQMRRIGNGREMWLDYPLSTFSEPEKMIAPLTDISGLSIEHQARLYMNASLHGADRFFMQGRRRVKSFERPIPSGGNARRIWYGYSPYDPSIYIKLAELYRLYYNYVVYKRNKDKKTPAMRLGLAKGPVTLEKIIYFDR